MIGRITGKLIARHPPQVIVDVQGIGYEIDVPMSTFYQLPAAGGDVTLYTHLLVREDAHLLYGFASEQERHVFRQLLKISGVGARTALSVLSGMSIADLYEAVAAQDSARLIKVPGIGKKTAERLLLAFAVPVLGLMIVESGISRAHANWAAVSYVAGTVLIVGWLDRIERFWPVGTSLGLHVVLFAGLTLLFAGAIPNNLPKALDGFNQMRGWRNLSNLASQALLDLPPGSPAQLVIDPSRLARPDGDHVQAEAEGDDGGRACPQPPAPSPNTGRGGGG